MAYYHILYIIVQLFTAKIYHFNKTKENYREKKTLSAIFVNPLVLWTCLTLRTEKCLRRKKNTLFRFFTCYIVLFIRNSFSMKIYWITKWKPLEKKKENKLEKPVLTIFFNDPFDFHLSSLFEYKRSYKAYKFTIYNQATLCWFIGRKMVFLLV